MFQILNRGFPGGEKKSWKVNLFPVYALLFLTTGLTPSSSISNPGNGNRARNIIHLLDYIGRDYVNAVSDGVVIDEGEYLEMTEFSESLTVLFYALCEETQVTDSAELGIAMRKLQSLVVLHASADSVAKLASELRNKITALGLLQLSPSSWPDLSAGKALFLQNCSGCHGETGDGKGVMAPGLDPAPSDFHDSQLMERLSPLQVYNTIRLGVSGTSMVPFDKFSEDELWELSFYILSLRCQGSKHMPAENSPQPALDEMASLSEAELAVKYGVSREAMTSLRCLEKPGESGGLARARKLLGEVRLAVGVGNRELANELALQAYLDGIEPVENRISASDNRLVRDIEVSLLKVRFAIREEKTQAEISALLDNALAFITEADALLAKQEKTPAFTAFISSSILLREGLEAFLIIISILGVLRSLNAGGAAKWVHGGWISALAVSALGLFFIDLLGDWNIRSREVAEGITALFSVVILLYMGFWLHSKTKAGRWQEFIEVRIRSMVNSSSMFGLAFISFIVVFREAIESLLFLYALRIDAGPENSIGIWIGFGIAAIALLIITWALLRLFRKVPVRKIFIYSSLVILFISVVMTGEGIHALQEGGLIAASPAWLNIRLPIFGIYPTFECLLSQACILVAVMLLLKFGWAGDKKAMAGKG